MDMNALIKIYLNQIPADQIDKRLPTFHELLEFYGPTVAIIVSIVFLFLVLFLWAQYYWFNKRMKDKKDELARLIAQAEKLHERNELLWQQLFAITGTKPH